MDHLRKVRKMAEGKIYHGSNVEVSNPKILQDGFYKDFGYGFYCTKMEKQAIRWALTRHGESIVNEYTYAPDDSLKVKVFDEMSDEWLDFVEGCISREAFWALVKFNYPTHQIVFCTSKALETLKFKRSREI